MKEAKQYKPLTEQEKKHNIEEAENKLIRFILEAIRKEKGVLNQ